MGMYTELNVAFRIRGSAPTSITETIKSMVTGEGRNFTQGAQHPLFARAKDGQYKTRWAWMLKSGGSSYFHGVCQVALEECEYDDGAFEFSVRTNIKNYDQEWELFLDWIVPYIEGNGYIGTLRYEEADEPTLLFVNAGQLTKMTVGEHQGKRILELENRIKELEQLNGAYLEKLAG